MFKKILAYLSSFKAWASRLIAVEKEVRVVVDSNPLSPEVKKTLATALGAAIDVVIDKELSALPATVRVAAKTEVASLIASSALLK